jgi:hypothetical protein
LISRQNLKSLLTSSSTKTRPRTRNRLSRLVVNGIPDRRSALRLPADGRSLCVRQSLPRICQALRRGAGGGYEADAQARARAIQGRLPCAQYQMQTETLAQRLGVSTFVANEMLSQHRGLFNRFWAWTEDWIAHALDQGSMRTPLGWACRTGITELNARSIGNYPIQGSGADTMRLACVWAHRRGDQLVRIGP